MALVLVLTSCNGRLSVTIDDETSVFGSLDGSGELATTTFALDGFDHVDVSSAFDVEITVGDKPFVEVVTDDNLVEDLDVRVVDNELRIGFADNTSIGNGTFRATVRLPLLVALDTSGASSVNVVGAYGPDQQYDVSGASTVNVSGKGTYVEVDASGASTIDLNLQDVTEVEVDLSGASELSLLAVATVSGDLSGASTMTVPADARVEADLSGASSVERN